MESGTPIYDFSGLKKLLRSKGFFVGKPQAYRALKVEDVSLNSSSSNLMINDKGLFYIIDPIDGVHRPVFLYMRDYRVNYYRKNPVFHLCNCQILQQYPNGYYRRANTEKVLVRDRDTGEEMTCRLNLCQYCSQILLNGQQMTTADYERIMKQAAAKSESNDYKEKELDFHGYTKDWKQVSDAYRNLQDFTCEECGVKITDPFDYLYMHVHHISGVKTNNRQQNLKCLCIECHSKVDDKHRKNFSTKAQRVLIEEFRKKYR